MWPFTKKQQSTGIKASSIVIDGRVATVDVRGQTCPGYLLAINKAVESLDTDMEARLLITYPPCGEDVHAWCKEKKVEYKGLAQQDGMWVITVYKPRG